MAGVTLFEHAYFSGKSQRFDIGRHDIHTLRIVENDTVSSLRVSVGYTHILIIRLLFKDIEQRSMSMGALEVEVLNSVQETTTCTPWNDMGSKTTCCLV